MATKTKEASELSEQELDAMVSEIMAQKRARLETQEKRLRAKLSADDSSQKEILVRLGKIAVLRADRDQIKEKISVLRKEIKSLKPARRRKNTEDKAAA